MVSTIKLLIQELQRALFSRRFLLCTLGYTILLCISVDRNSDAGVIYQFQFIYATGFYMLFLICATMPFADSYLRDYCTKSYTTIIQQTTITAYLRTKVIVTVLSGALCIMISSILLICYLVFRFPLNTLSSTDYDGYGVLLNDGQYLLYFVIRISLTCVIGSVFATFALMCSPILKNTNAVNFLPLFSFYIFNELINFGYIPEVFNLTKILYTPYSFFDGMISNYLFSLAVLVGLITLFGSCFVKTARRQISND